MYQFFFKYIFVFISTHVLGLLFTMYNIMFCYIILYMVNKTKKKYKKNTNKKKRHHSNRFNKIKKNITRKNINKKKHEDVKKNKNMKKKRKKNFNKISIKNIKGGYNNTCVILENLRRGLKLLDNSFDFYKYRTLDNNSKTYIQSLIPTMILSTTTMNNSLLSINDPYNLLSLDDSDRNIMVHNIPINSGANGDIFSVSHKGQDFILKIPKINPSPYKTVQQQIEELRDNTFSEIIIQNELWCHFNNLRGSNGVSYFQNVDFASIPRIELFLNYQKNEGYHCYSVLMENLNGSFIDFIKEENDIRHFCHMIIQLSNFITDLQNFTQFMHRDFHSGNIMYRSYVNNQNIKHYKWYIIDFGYASIKYNQNENLCLHTEQNCNYNPTIDFRTLFSNIHAVIPIVIPIHKNHLFYKIIDVYVQYIDYVKKDNVNWWHDTYYWKLDKVDPIFNPRNIYSVFTEIMNMIIHQNLNEYDILKMVNTRLSQIRQES